MSNYIRRFTLDVFRTGLIGSAVALVFFFIQWKPIEPVKIFDAFVVGSLVGVLEFSFYRRFAKQWPFPMLVLSRAILYAILVSITVFFSQCVAFNCSPLSVVEKIQTESFVVIAAQSYFLCMLLFLHLQLETLVGKGVMEKFFLGRYAKAREEDRIFMFIDMKGSTMIAEKLGDRQYYDFLNHCFNEFSRPIFETQAEIYKYIGDEIVISWPIKKGLKNNNCVNLFFMMREKLHKRRHWFLKKYGVFPQFKAGIHCGSVVTAQIGDLKKEIAFNGDVVNTTSRIQDMCNTYNARLLMSKELFDQLSDTHKEYSIEVLGDVKLKGREQKINLVKIRKRNRTKSLFERLDISEMLNKFKPSGK